MSRCIGDHAPILAIDPGRDTGVSYSPSSTTIVHAVSSLYSYAYAFKKYVRALEGPVALIEVPRVYPERRAEDPNDLITLAIRIGAYAEMLASLGFVCLGVEPRKWKGQLSKEAHHARLLRDFPTLAGEVARNVEKESKRHNAYDAFGLLVWGGRNRGTVLRDLRKDL